MDDSKEYYEKWMAQTRERHAQLKALKAAASQSSANQNIEMPQTARIGNKALAKNLLADTARNLFVRQPKPIQTPQKNLAGSAQVTAVSGKMPDTSELSGETPDNLAGASPHAPATSRQEKKKENQREFRKRKLR